MTNAAELPTEIENPIDPELISTTDVDALIDAIEAWTKLDKEIYAAKTMAIRALVALTDSDARTRRIQGRRRKAVIEMPGTNWDNSKLKEAWNSYPQFRDQYLRIAEIAPQLREVNKLRETSGPPDLECFKSIIESAERQPTRNPTVKIEQ